MGSVTPSIPSVPGGWQVLLVDPPWHFKTYSAKGEGSRHPKHKYTGGTMSLDAIKALPVGDLAAKDSMLLLWVTVPFAELAHEVVRAWGFRY